MMKQQRKTLAASGIKTPKSQKASSNISSFARVSKTVAVANVKPQKEEEQPRSSPSKTPKNSNNKTSRIEVILTTPASRKRKNHAAAATSADEGDDDDSSANDDERRPRKRVVAPSVGKKSAAGFFSSPSKTAPAPVTRGRDGPSSPNKKEKARPGPVPAVKKRARSPSVNSDSDASSIDAKVLFKKLRLDSSPSRCSSTPDTSLAGSDIEADAQRDELPEEILSLISLHTAFLRALALHYAHNGFNVPVDLRSLCPDVARAWGKKKVTAADIRTCLGVLNRSPSDASSNLLGLVNYGRGKICVEMNQVGRVGALSELKLNALFVANVKTLWNDFLAGGGTTDTAMTTFMPTLPKAPVALCESVVKAAPILLKGQQRLEDLKQGIAAKKQATASSSKQLSIAAAGTPLTNPDGSKMSLLDRIRLKAQQKASMPAGLSPAQLERRAALHRVEEVASLIGMLSRATDEGGRVSFPMAVMLEKLKDSFRMGISRQEGAVCIRLLAGEVAPEWVRVVTLSGRENVVVETAAQLGKPEVARRVKDILARE
ncbi:hypothetical protein GGR50DRAFT_635103 [Xylaria sp. CBS 124048]|nr:hypothetical protein GGR50DRAFT_635103 [Xylaria sp. CBS 124048]